MFERKTQVQNQTAEMLRINVQVVHDSDVYHNIHGMFPVISNEIVYKVRAQYCH